MSKEFKHQNNETITYEIYQKLDEIRKEKDIWRITPITSRQTFNEKYGRLETLEILERFWVKELAKNLEISNPYDN